MSKIDVLIIGSGAGGAAVAYGLTQLGIKVLIIEAGSEYSLNQSSHLNSDNWEKPFPENKNSRGQYSYNVSQKIENSNFNIRSWNHIQGLLNKTNHRISFGYHHLRALGGSSLIYTGEAHRLNPRSMRLFSDYHVGADWPFTYDELEPYYLMAEKIIGVAGPSDDKFHPRSEEYPYPPHRLNYYTNILLNVFRQQNLNLVPNSLAVLPEARAGRLPCNYCACCQKGCPRLDKGTMDVTYLKSARDTGLCTVLTDTVVTKIISDERQRVKSVQIIDRSGSRKEISANLIVLSAGAIESPRLLLASANNLSPRGLSNESGQVGKNFMETILWTSSALLDHSGLASYRGLPVDAICWDFNHPNAIPDVIGGCRFSPSVAESDLLGPVAYATRVIDGWGKSHKQKMRQNFGQVISLTGIGESLPNVGSFVDLDPKTKDANGIPIARIHSKLTHMDVRRIRFMANFCRKILSLTTKNPIFEEFSSYDIFSSTHVFGTCKMGTDPSNSVVNQWGQSHSYKNLYIIDASIFPSSGGGESPSLTIQALGLRAARHIKNSLNNLA